VLEPYNLLYTKEVHGVYVFAEDAHTEQLLSGLAQRASEWQRRPGLADKILRLTTEILDYCDEDYCEATYLLFDEDGKHLDSAGFLGRPAPQWVKKVGSKDFGLITVNLV
jgi:hypothetical protein